MLVIFLLGSKNRGAFNLSWLISLSFVNLVSVDKDLIGEIAFAVDQLVDLDPRPLVKRDGFFVGVPVRVSVREAKS